MPFRKVQSEKLSQSIIAQIEALILRGILRPGDRLPSERDLSEQMGVSRPSLREALGVLQDDGLLVSRAGAGIFVADVLGSAFSPALTRLMSSHEDAVFDVIAFRKDMEGLAAERAAKFGSDSDLQVIDAAFAKMVKARDKRPSAEEALLDAQFHMAIVEASHNVMLLHMMRSMYQMLQDGVFYNRQVMFRHRTSRDKLLDQHRAINDALQARQPEMARQALHDHLDFVARALHDQMKADRDEVFAKLKAEHGKTS